MPLLALGLTLLWQLRRLAGNPKDNESGCFHYRWMGFVDDWLLAKFSQATGDHSAIEYLKVFALIRILLAGPPSGAVRCRRAESFWARQGGVEMALVSLGVGSRMGRGVEVAILPLIATLLTLLG
jgi:hypothetical protein